VEVGGTGVAVGAVLAVEVGFRPRVAVGTLETAVGTLGAGLQPVSSQTTNPPRRATNARRPILPSPEAGFRIKSRGFMMMPP